ncbi:hypothetical protein GCM10023175_13450 [Pseudonocardia xishanensis]|uniref:Uncharacterized protein n=1 Tax=Pseudonocardia xishanensis TaxID=630995 RepID=A0ABP8RKS3_9PSEU
MWVPRPGHPPGDRDVVRPVVVQEAHVPDERALPLRQGPVDRRPTDPTQGPRAGSRTSTRRARPAAAEDLEHPDYTDERGPSPTPAGGRSTTAPTAASSAPSTAAPIAPLRLIQTGSDWLLHLVDDQAPGEPG